MEDEVHVLTLRYINTLNRHALIDEVFAETLAETARIFDSDPSCPGTSEAIFAMARHHRIAAIKYYAHAAALSNEYDTSSKFVKLAREG